MSGSSQRDAWGCTTPGRRNEIDHVIQVRPACRTCCRTVTLAGARDRTNCTNYRSVPRSRGKSSTPEGSRAGTGRTSWSVPTVACSLSSRKDDKLPEEVGVVEVDPGMRDLLVFDLHHRTAVDAPFSSSGGYVRQRALVGATGAPANDDVTLARGKDRLHIEVQIGKRREIELEELPRPLMPPERRRKRVRLPYCLRVQPLDEGLHVVRVPSRKALSGDVKVVLSSHGQPPPKSCEAMQFPFGLLQPEPHVHLAVHGCRDGEVLLCLVALAGASVKLPEAEVAVGDERAHAARLGEGQRLAVVGLAALGIEPVGVGRDVTEQVERMGRGPGLTGRGLHRAVAQALRVIETAEHQRGSTQPPIERSENAEVSPRGLALEKLLTFPEPAQALARLAELRQGPGGGDDRCGEQLADVPRPAHCCRMLEQRARLCPVTPQQVNRAYDVVGEADDERMLRPRRDSDRLGFGLRRFGESAELGQASHQPEAIVDRWGLTGSEELIDPVGGEHTEVVGGQLDCPLVLAPDVVRLHEVASGED